MNDFKTSVAALEDETCRHLVEKRAGLPAAFDAKAEFRQIRRSSRLERSREARTHVGHFHVHA